VPRWSFADDGNKALRKLVRDGFRSWKSRLAVLVGAGKQNGEIRTTVDTRQVPNTFVALIDGFRC